MNKLKGALYVGLGAASYGILATIVKFANNQDVHTSMLTFAQSLTGVIVLSILAFAYKMKRKTPKVTPKAKFKLMLFGTAMGLTSCFYYLSIQYVSVSVGIILLMQSIWMSIVWEIIQTKNRPHWVKVLGGIIVILGTILATDLLNDTVTLSWIGIGYGMLAAITYTITLHASSHVETGLPTIVRSQYLIIGSLIMVMIFWNKDIITYFDASMGLKWGVLLGIFGTVIPPILFTKGIPLTGLGLAGIIAAIEIPVSIFSARMVLHEAVSPMQWLGVGIILGTIVMINLKSEA